MKQFDALAAKTFNYLTDHNSEDKKVKSSKNMS